MSCCCHSPLAATLGAGFLVLGLFVPALFVGVVQLVFHWNEQDNIGLSVFWVLCEVFATVAAVTGLIGRETRRTGWLRCGMWTGLLAFLLSIGATIWTCVNWVQKLASTEGKTIATGTVFLLAIPLCYMPLVWLSYELHSLSRQLIGRSPFLAPDSSYHDVQNEAYVALLGGPSAPLEAGSGKGPADDGNETVAMSLARGRPFGRAQRGTRTPSTVGSRRGRYETPAGEQRQASLSRKKSEMSGTSDSEESN